ncbi:MAG: MFS transporter [Rubrobacter sp.]|nr:MFS transporter [Rubrobacter sp.]
MRRLLVLTCAIVLVDTIFYAALVPLIPYYTEEFGLSKGMVGVVNGAFGAGILLGAPPGAYLAFRVGVKRTAVAGLLLLSVTSFLFGFAGGAGTLTLLRLGEGFGSAFSWIAAFTWLVSRAPEEKRGQMIGTLISAAVVGALLGPVLGSAAAGFGIVPAFSAVAALGAGTAVWAALEPPPANTETGFSLRSLRALLSPRPATGFVLIALAPLLFSVLVVLAPLEFSALGWGATAIGAVFLVGAAFEAAVHPPLGRLSDRVGYRLPVSVGLVVSILLLLVLPVAGNPWVLGTLVVLAAGAFNFSLTPGTALFTKSSEGAGIGRALGFGVTNVAWAGGFAAGAPLGGFLADLGGNALSYLTLAAVCVVMLLVLRRVV